MQKQPLVSVLIPSYNYGRFIAKTIISAASQTYKNLEILVLDDGSIDQSFEIAQDLARQDSRIKVWKQSNRGLISTLNTLFQASRGEFVVQIDADDMLLHNRVAWGLEDMQKDPDLSASFCSFVRVDADDQLVGGSNQLFTAPYQGKNFAERLVITNFVCACTAFMRASAVRASGGFARDYSLVHDWDRWLRMSLHGPMYLRTDVGGIHRLHGQNQSLDEASSNRQQLEIAYDMTKKVMQHYDICDVVKSCVHSAMAQRQVKLKDYNGAISSLAARSLIAPLVEHERIWLLQCLFNAGRHRQAADLAALLQPIKETMHIESQEQLKVVDTALKSLYKRCSNTRPSNIDSCQSFQQKF